MKCLEQTIELTRSFTILQFWWLVANALNNNTIAMNIFACAPKIASPNLPWPRDVIVHYSKPAINRKLNRAFTILILIFSFPSAFGQLPSSETAKDYLNEYLEIVKKHSMNRDSIQWETFTDSLYLEAKGAQNSEETYPAIKKSIKRLKDGHSFLMTAAETKEWKTPKTSAETKDTIPGPVPYGKLIDNVGYISLPWFHSGNQRSCQLFADTLLSVVKSLDSNNLTGWVIDLRDNLGGNNWPMHAGISPFYSQEIVGGFIYPNGEFKEWVIKDNAIIEKDSIIGKTSETYTLKNSQLPIAVLMNRSTASSGETVLVSFIGETNTRTFGQPSGGSTTCNELFPLSDGAQLLLTVSVYADRNRNPYYGQIKPDVLVEKGKELENALIWIEKINQ